jgi:hypothetical protein
MQSRSLSIYEVANSIKDLRETLCIKINIQALIASEGEFQKAIAVFASKIFKIYLNNFGLLQLIVVFYCQ